MFHQFYTMDPVYAGFRKKLKHMAPGEVARLDLPELGTLFPAFIRCIGAAGAETAALGCVHGAGQFALNGDSLTLTAQFGVSNGNSGDQSLGIGVQRILEDFLTGAQLHHAA